VCSGNKGPNTRWELSTGSKFLEEPVQGPKIPPVVYIVKCSKFSLKFEDKFSF